MIASQPQLPHKPYTPGRAIHALVLAAGILLLLLLVVLGAVVVLSAWGDTLPGVMALFVVAVVVSVAGGFFYEKRLQEQWLEEYTQEIEPQFLSASEVEAIDESRREIVAAFEIERRRIERDLHDSTQQYLVAATMGVGEVALAVELEGEANAFAQRIAPLVEAAQNNLEEALRQLRATVRGIHPKVLSDMGLEAAVRDLASSSALPVVVRVPYALPDIPEGVTATAYFFVAEALTNAAKYAPGSTVSVLLAADRDLHVSVMDDGPGGVVLRPEGGLVGLRERLAAFGGTLIVTSPSGGPTQLVARIPLLIEKGNFTRAQP